MNNDPVEVLRKLASDYTNLADAAERLREHAIASANSNSTSVPFGDLEAAARRLERAMHPRWTDAQFENWWNNNPHFTEHIADWDYFTGTHKEHAIWRAKKVLGIGEEVVPAGNSGMLFNILHAKILKAMLPGEPVQQLDLLAKLQSQEGGAVFNMRRLKNVFHDMRQEGLVRFDEHRSDYWQISPIFLKSVEALP